VFDLKGYDRVLFLDSDILITKSVEDLMRYDYNGNIGMVPDYGFIKPKTFKITNGVIDDSFNGWYCGGGFFIIDNIILS
jgi:alpha-N-acetylglucosamine transferase